jgi:hypothetical protein
VFYKTGSDLEKAIFDEQSEGLNLVREFWGKSASFGPDVKFLLEKSKTVHPNTKIGAALHRQVVRQLSRDLDPNGLIFLSTINTKVDARHQTDGLFYLPSLYPHLVTVDAFNVPKEDTDWFRDKWIDDWGGNLYSESDFQSDLFRHKKGFATWRKTNKFDAETFSRFDFRPYTEENRPENHFVLTPSMIGTYEARRSFAKLVAGYFLKVADKKNG